MQALLTPYLDAFHKLPFWPTDEQIPMVFVTAVASLFVCFCVGLIAYFIEYVLSDGNIKVTKRTMDSTYFVFTTLATVMAHCIFAVHVPDHINAAMICFLSLKDIYMGIFGLSSIPLIIFWPTSAPYILRVYGVVSLMAIQGFYFVFVRYLERMAKLVEAKQEREYQEKKAHDKERQEHRNMMEETQEDQKIIDGLERTLERLEEKKAQEKETQEEKEAQYKEAFEFLCWLEQQKKNNTQKDTQERETQKETQKKET